MDPNHGAKAPLEYYAGIQFCRLIHTTLFPSYWAPKWHPSKKREKDRTLTLGGHHSMGEYNNKPKVGVGKGLEGREMVRWAITKGWDIFSSFGGSNKHQKN
jgi:hypothetical protein